MENVDWYVITQNKQNQTYVYYLQIDINVCMKNILLNWCGMLNLSHPMGKPTICIGENKGADQLRGNREADQRHCFRYSDSNIPLLLKSEISSFWLFSVLVQVLVGLFWTCSETTLLVFPRGGSFIVDGIWFTNGSMLGLSVTWRTKVIIAFFYFTCRQSEKQQLCLRMTLLDTIAPMMTR